MSYIADGLVLNPSGSTGEWRQCSSQSIPRLLHGGDPSESEAHVIALTSDL